MKKRLIFSYILFLVYNMSIAQIAQISLWNGIDYDAPVVYPTPNIASDFGPRDLTLNSGKKSRFHSGVDLLHPQGSGGLIGNLQSGTITRLDGNIGLKVLVVQFADRAFAYTHIFDDKYPTSSNNCWLRNDAKDADGDAFPCILYKFGGTYYAIGERAGTIDVNKDNKIIKTVSTFIKAVGTGHPCYIGAYGNSGTSIEHLHLGLLKEEVLSRVMILNGILCSLYITLNQIIISISMGQILIHLSSNILVQALLK